ncbi:OsmC/Ohr family, partial [Lasiosphaeria miniovina]
LGRAQSTSAQPLLGRAQSTSAQFPTIPVAVHGTGRGTFQTVPVQDKPYTIPSDTYTALGGGDSAPSPVAYSLASLGACSQVTGSVVARDQGVALGVWSVTVRGALPKAVLVGGAAEGNPNWEGVAVEVKVQTDIPGGSEAAGFRHFVSETERRCPITQLFKLSGVKFESEWVNEVLPKG